ncbi:MAG: hypothetical protein M3N12_10825 [Verrucomicrobiota bacterium]|nr:hypothetical protein [Verrucomicrobiota bacterium]
MNYRSLGVFCLVIAALAAHGELPPYVYQELQAKSPEALTIKVESVSVATSDEPTLKRLAITAEAKVEKVSRSAAGLKPGDAIRITYIRLEHKQPMAGPSEPEILQKGRSYPAFLAKAAEDQVYSLAARSFSFRLLN